MFNEHPKINRETKNVLWDLSIGFSPSGCGMESYPPHAGSIPIK
jgi:hypothetical protein